MKNVFKNKQVGLLSGFVIVFGVGFSAGFFYYKGQFNASFVERQSTKEALSETDDYKIQTQMKVSERTPQSKIRTALKIIDNIYFENGKRLFPEEHLIHFKSRDFRNTYIRRSDFSKGNFDGADFEDSILLGVDMAEASFIEANFKNAHLIRAPRFTKRVGSGQRNSLRPQLTGANFSKANFQDAVITALDLENINFTEAQMQGVIFKIHELIPVQGKPKQFTIEGYETRTNKKMVQGKRNHFTAIEGYSETETFSWGKQSIPEEPYESMLHGGDVVDGTTDFSGAFLQGADLRELRALDKTQLTGASYNSQTKFPPSWGKSDDEVDRMAQSLGMIKVN